jgi:hypothetical protein
MTTMLVQRKMSLLFSVGTLFKSRPNYKPCSQKFRGLPQLLQSNSSTRTYYSKINHDGPFPLFSIHRELHTNLKSQVTRNNLYT